MFGRWLDDLSDLDIGDLNRHIAEGAIVERLHARARRPLTLVIDQAADAVADEELPFLRPRRSADCLLDENGGLDRAVPPLTIHRHLRAAESGVQPMLQGGGLLRRQRKLQAPADAALMAELDIVLA